MRNHKLLIIAVALFILVDAVVSYFIYFQPKLPILNGKNTPQIKVVSDIPGIQIYSFDENTILSIFSQTGFYTKGNAYILDHTTIRQVPVKQIEIHITNKIQPYGQIKTDNLIPTSSALAPAIAKLPKIISSFNSLYDPHAQSLTIIVYSSDTQLSDTASVPVHLINALQNAIAYTATYLAEKTVISNSLQLYQIYTQAATEFKSYGDSSTNNFIRLKHT